MSLANQLTDLAPGFAQPSLDAQRAFRQILDAMARPGTRADLSFAPEGPGLGGRALGALALTLFDFETPLWLAPSLAGSTFETWVRFHCSAPRVDTPETCTFALALAPGELPPLDVLPLGDARYPDRSATVVVVLPSLTGGAPVRLAGPGIEGSLTITPQGLKPEFWDALVENRAQFQLGLDFMFCAGDELFALPRTTRVLPEGQASTPNEAERS